MLFLEKNNDGYRRLYNNRSGSNVFCKLCRSGIGRCFYEKRIQRCSNRKFKILPGEKRSGALCLMYDEQPFAFNNFC